MSRRGENIRKRKDGRWEARLLLNKDENGKYHYKYIYGNSYKDVKDKKQSMIMSINNDIPKENIGIITKVYDKKIVFSQLLNDWLFFIKGQVKQSTYARYYFNAHKHILPILGNYKVNMINTSIINQFAAKKLTEGRLNNDGGLSTKTVNCLLSIIKLVLNYGYENNIIDQYVKVSCVRYIPPKIKTISAGEWMTLAKYLLEHISNISIGILISMFTGLRIGEVCALKWKDICLDQGTILVTRTLMRIQNTEEDISSKTRFVIDEPKSECSKREIPLPSFLIEILKNNSTNEDFFILTGDEKFMEPRLYYKKYKEILNILGINKYNYHALRHTFATRCIELEFDIKSLSEILGHSDISITLTRYVHPSMDMKRKQMEKLNVKY